MIEILIFESNEQTEKSMVMNMNCQKPHQPVYFDDDYLNVGND